MMNLSTDLFRPKVSRVKRVSVSYNEVRSLLDYDAHTGNLIWKRNAGTKVKAGSVAGWTTSGGYSHVQINGTALRAHRLVFLWHHGYLPENDIDHIDGNKTNNRIENLRETSRSCNTHNKPNQKNNTSGVKGVSYKEENGKWCARISIDGRRYELGYYEDFDNAVAARYAAEQCTGAERYYADSPAAVHIKNITGRP